MYFPHIKDKHTDEEKKLFNDYGDFFNKSPLPIINKLCNFSKYIRRQDIARFLAKLELFKLQLDIPGVIIECGTYMGGGLMTFAQLSAIFEPYNHTRKIIGFDTFKGFPDLHSKDMTKKQEFKKGSLRTFDGIENEIQEAISFFDRNRPLSHIKKVELAKGDACKTIPIYLKENPHIVISMLYLDFDLYEPTKIALENFLDRIPKGGIIAFDELNTENFPGETIALLKVVGIKNLKIKKTIFDPYISYAQIE